MNERSLEDRVRTWYRPLADEPAPASLRAAVIAIPDRIPVRAGWRDLLRSRSMLVVGTVLIGGAILAGALIAGGGPPRSVVAPSVRPTATAQTAEASATPASTSAASVAGTSYPATSAPARNGLIAYSSAGRIHLVGPDGVEVRTLGSRNATDYFPRWSPDGTKLAFLSESCHPIGDHCPNKTDPASLMVTNADGSGRRQLAGNLENPLTIAWSPDGSAIAIDPFPAPTITVVSVADGRVAKLGVGQFPVWTPDGTSIVYEGGGDGGADAIAMVNPDGSGAHVFVGRTDAGVPTGPEAWTLDGSKLLYGLARGILSSNNREWVVNRDGTDPHELAIPGPGEFISLSPNGRLVLWFVKDTAGGGNGHYVVTLSDGSAPHLVEVAGGSVRWSPDGTRLIGTPPSAGQAVPQSGLVIVDPTRAETPVTIQVDGGLLGWSWQGLP